MGLTDGGPILPITLVAPLALLTFIAVAGHVWLLRDAEMPESRRRIRSANGMLMLMTIPVATYAMGVATTAFPRAFVLSWLTVVGLLGLVVLMACLDILNNLRLRHAERRRLAVDIAVLRQELATVRELRPVRTNPARDHREHHPDDPNHSR